MKDSRPWWLWPNLLALDAPAVAVVWQSFLATEEGINVPIAAIGTLALTVWGIYLTDRWLDVRGGRNSHFQQVTGFREGTARHRFAERNSLAVGALASLALVIAAIIAGVSLPNKYLDVGGVVAVLMIGYFGFVHLVPAGRVRFRGLKEFFVGALFAIGIAIPLMVGTAQTGQEWVAGAIAFGGLCSMNCILISRWEDKPSSAPSSWTVLAASGIAACAAFSARFNVTTAVLASLGLLLGLVLLRSWFSTKQLRVLADTVLLSPVVITVML